MVSRIIKLLISLGFCPFLLLWRTTLSLFGFRSQPPCVILLYHQVLEGERRRFAKQMDRLLQLGVPVSLENPDPTHKWGLQISVTFDDGIRNFIQNALPALVDRNIPTTIFFPTGYFGKYPDWIYGQDPQDESRWVMTVEEAVSLAPDLIGVGSHTVNHKKLNRLTPEEIRTELGDSKTELEKALGRPVLSIAFPYGEYDDRVVQASKQAGYLQAYAADPVWTDGYVAGRVDTSPLDWPLEFCLKALGGYRWLPIAFFLKRLLIARS